jgi:hypothetical protein
VHEPKSDRVGRRLMAALVLASLLACKVSAGDDLKAKVDCTGGETTVDCDVAHVAGSSAANVCFDLRYVCLNGEIVTGANFCQPVAPGATSQKRIPLAELSNSQRCDKVASSEVQNLRIKEL